MLIYRDNHRKIPEAHRYLSSSLTMHNMCPPWEELIHSFVFMSPAQQIRHTFRRHTFIHPLTSCKQLQNLFKYMEFSTCYFLVSCFITQISGFSQSPTCILKMMHISNLQLLMHHSTETKQICACSFIRTEVMYLFFFNFMIILTLWVSSTERVSVVQRGRYLILQSSQMRVMRIF